MTRLFGRLQGLQGVFSLTGKQAGNFNRIMGEMNKSSGETEKAYKKMTNTMAFQTKRMKVQFQIFKIMVGKALAPIFKVFVTGFSKIISIFKYLASTFPLLAKIVASIVGITFVLVILIGTVMMAKFAFAAMAPAIMTALAPILPFLLPIIAGLTATIALGYALRKAYKNNLGGFADTINEIWKGIDLVVGSMWEMLTTGEVVGKRVQGVIDNKWLWDIIQLVSWLRAAFINLAKGVVDGFKSVSGVFKPFESLFQDIGKMINRISDSFNKLWGNASGTKSKSAMSTMQAFKKVGYVIGKVLGWTVKIVAFAISAWIRYLVMFIEIVIVKITTIVQFFKDA